ncbi:YraN family protein [soil metagenome]
MTDHIETGKAGEDLASIYLENKGYSIIERNFRSRRNEVDIIASQKNILHFVEVKTRSNLDFALPETKVKGPKLKHLKEAAETYLFLHPEWKDIQFDILSIIKKDDGNNSYFMIEDVF